MGNNNSTTAKKLRDIAEYLDATYVGNGDKFISGIASLRKASANQLSFLANPKYVSDLISTQAGAVILSEKMAAQCPVDHLIISDPYWAYARVSRLFERNPLLSSASVHASAVVAGTASIDPTASVGANAVIEAGAQIGAYSVIGSGCVVGHDVRIGKHCLIYPNVTLYHNVVLGEHVTIHSGSVIGADGFGFAPHQSRWEKIAQLGTVRIGNRVEIGANTCIDRGALEDTIIGDDVIIDNLVQIAHNVEIGEGTAIAGKSAVSGSTKVGRCCTIAGGVGIAGHLELADHVHVSAMSIVTKNLKEAGSYSSGAGGAIDTTEWRKNAVQFRRLSEMYDRLVALEKKVFTAD